VIEDREPPEGGAVSRRSFITTATSLASAVALGGVPSLPSLQWRQRRPVPSAAQLAWQRDELAMFLHFGVNTFTDREWGDGKESPTIFSPSSLDARQWAKVAKAAGFRMMILTAKHHDGFCLWPTATTTHSVASSPFRGGGGDVVMEFVLACRIEGMKVGLYCSPWDRNSPVYGDSERYNDLFCDQLTELLTRYGRIDEVWFDGANGEGPNGKKQVYDWPRFFAHVKKLQPETVIFSDAGPDVRWIGNERGVAGDTNWSTMDPAAVPYPGADGPNIVAALQTGDPNGSVWRPGETDVSIRPGWFYHPAEDDKVKTVDQLVDLYFTSVGRNSKLLLNVPPTRAGLLHHTDVSRLTEMQRRLSRLFANEIAAGARPRWTFLDSMKPACDVNLGQIHSITIADLAEDITTGQVVTRYRLEGMTTAWRDLAVGTTIGYRKLDRFDPVRVRRVRLTLEVLTPLARAPRIRLYSRSS
jgi:alpha-L-fucosidase